MRKSYFSGRIIFDHLPKTAGQAVNYWLTKTLGSGCVTPNLIGKHRDLIRRYGGDFSVISAHVDFDGFGLDPRYQYMTLFREPLDRAISFLYFVVKNHEPEQFPGLWESAKRFIDSQGAELEPDLLGHINNPYVKHLASITNRIPRSADHMLGDSMSVLDQYDVWGLYEEMPSFLADVAALIGLSAQEQIERVNVTNARPAVTQISPSLRKRLEELNALDLELYCVLRERWRQARIHKTSIILSDSSQWEPYTSPVHDRVFAAPEFTLISVELEGDNVFTCSQILRFELEFSIAVAVEELEIGIHIFDDEGRWAFGTNTTLLGRPLRHLGRGTYRLCYYLVADLPEGQYSAGFAIVERCAEGNRELAWYDKLVLFQVTVPRLKPSVGYVSLPVEFNCWQTSEAVTSLVEDAAGMLASDAVLGDLAVGEACNLPVHLENSSAQSWISTVLNPICLCYHWLDMAGNTVVIDGERTPLPVSEVLPGQLLPAQMRVVAPSTPGRYRLVLVPVQEGCCWFDTKGFAPGELELVVVAPDVPRCYPGADVRLSSHVGRREGSAMLSTGQEGFLLFGPYAELSAGKYQVFIHGSVGERGLDGASMDVTADKGNTLLAAASLISAVDDDILCSIAMRLNSDFTDIEVRVWVEAGSDISISMIEINYISLFESTDVMVRIDSGDQIQSTSIVEAVDAQTTYPLSDLERVHMTVSCQDCDEITKVSNAGSVIVENGKEIQIMHDGTKVVAGRYCGGWMQQIIQDLRGHHEPQEELLFHEILKSVCQDSLLVEFGCWWACYTNWYLGAVSGSKAVCIEPDENHLKVGQENLKLNDRERRVAFYMAAAGEKYQSMQCFRRESDQKQVSIDVWDFQKLLDVTSTDCIELLHMDVQGGELPFLKSISKTAYKGKLRFVVISTHHELISGSPTTHRDCLKELILLGAIILCEHSVEESFSGDGLIIASFSPDDVSIQLPHISRNKAESSLFGPAPQRIAQQDLGGDYFPIPPDLPEEVDCEVELVKTDWGPMYIHKADSVIGASLKSTGSFQTSKIKEVTEHLSARYGFLPETFIDIGSNIGTHLIYALKSGLFRNGFGVEPNPLNFTLLGRNVVANELKAKARIYQLALSNRCGAATFELCDSNYGDHRIRTGKTECEMSLGEDKRESISVLTERGDEFFPEYQIPLSNRCLMWIDTQGHEGHVFDGFHKLLTSDARPYIVCEFWPYGLERAGGKKMLFDFLSRCTKVFDINRSDWQQHPESSIERLDSLYQTMLSDTRANYYPHTDLLCVL